MPPTRPFNPKELPAAPYVDNAEFLKLTPLSNEGIGGIPGSKDFPQGTFKGFQALKKPDESTVVPRCSAGKTVALPTTTTITSTPSPVVTSAVSTTTTATTPAPSSPLLNGRQKQEPKVNVSLMSLQQVQDAYAKLTAQANPNLTGQGKAKAKGPTSAEPLETETTRQTRHGSHTSEWTSCSRSASTTQDMGRKSLGGKGSSTQKTKESEKRPGQTGSAAMSATLLKAGAANPPGKNVGSIPKFTPDKEYVVDYSREPCPPPAFKVDQPSGSDLAEAPSQPKKTWHSNPNMSQATLHTHLQAVAQAGYQRALFRSQQGMLRTRHEAMHLWDHSTEAFERQAREPVFVDEVHAGTVLVSAYDLQWRKDGLNAELKAAHQEIEQTRLKNRDMLQTTVIMDKHIANLTTERDEARAAQDRTLAEIEQLKAAPERYRSELGSRGTTSSTNALVEHCEALEKELQIKDKQLQEACEAGSDPSLRDRLANLARERNEALQGVQGLLAEGLTLEAQHKDLKVELATTTAELKAQLRVAGIELESHQKQYNHEAKFAQSQKSEVGRLTEELKEAKSDIKNPKSRAQNLPSTSSSSTDHGTVPTCATRPTVRFAHPDRHYDPRTLQSSRSAVRRSSQFDCFTGTGGHSVWVCLRGPNPEPTGPQVPATTGYTPLFETTQLCGSGNPTGSAPTGAEPYR